jgi:hypothetical protein
MEMMMSSGLLGADGFPIGEVGKSQVPTNPLGGSMDPVELGRMYDAIQQRMASAKGEAILTNRASVNRQKVDSALSFWKPVYFGVSVEDRLMNGIEAYELGDPEKTKGIKCNKGPYIAMCNIMALEAILMMGEQMPTAEEGVLLAYASDREKDVCKFWKEVFAPTEFQVQWAWKAALGVMSGNKIAISELLEVYQDQLP